MKCIKCELPMAHVPVKQKYYFDACYKCGGRWVDGDVLHQHCSSLLSDGKDKTYQYFMQLRVNITDINCPSCEQQKLSLVVVNNTEMEFCTNCHGVYFDPGEMEFAMPEGNWHKPDSNIDKQAIAGGVFEVILGIISA